MRCSGELRELLPWYANGTLTGDERAKLEAHLARCGSCQRELAELRGLKEQIISSLESASEPSAELCARTIERIRSGERRTIAQFNWQLFALGFTLGVLYERGRVRIEPEIEALGWELKRRRR